MRIRTAIAILTLAIVPTVSFLTFTSEEDETMWNCYLMGNHSCDPIPSNNFGWVNLTD